MATAAELAKQQINSGSRKAAPAQPASPQISPDLAARANQYGITPGVSAPASRVVLRGIKKGTPGTGQKRIVKKLGQVPEGTYGPPTMVDVEEWSESPGTPDVPETQTEDEALMEFYKLPKDALKTLQQRLVKGGFLDPDAYSSGVHDEKSFEAWKVAVNRAANFYEAGETSVTLDSVLDAGEPVPGGGRQIVLTDPAEIRAVVQTSAPQIYGRRASDEEIDTLVSAYQSAEIERQSRGDGNSPGAAWIQEELRTLNPQSAEAFQGATNVESFLKMVNPQGVFSAYRQ